MKIILITLLIISMTATSSCTLFAPNASKAIDEAKQTELMKEQVELQKEQNQILTRIAVALEKK